MKLSQLSTQAIARLKTVRWDRIIEKHEGPETWESVFKYSTPELLEVEGRWVLLPVDSSQHPNLSILRSIWSEEGKSLTLFLKDTTFDDDPFFSGFLAVCEKIKGEEIYLAVVYHEWFIIDYPDGVFEG